VKTTWFSSSQLISGALIVWSACALSVAAPFSARLQLIPTGTGSSPQTLGFSSEEASSMGVLLEYPVDPALNYVAEYRNSLGADADCSG
jgi:hypothetical protein